jgi:hypothetical protein
MDSCEYEFMTVLVSVHGSFLLVGRPESQ